MPGSTTIGNYLNAPYRRGSGVAAAAADAGSQGQSTLDAAAALAGAVRHCLQQATLTIERVPLDGKAALRLTLRGPFGAGWDVDGLITVLTAVGIAVDGGAGLWAARA